MNQAIKERIEKIKRGEVPEGYKSTKSGSIPLSWNSVKLRKLATPIKEKVQNRRLEVLSITAGVGFVNQADKFGKEIAGAQYQNYTVLRKGDFSYNKGNSKTYPQGCIYMLEDRDEAAVPNVFISFRFKAGIHTYYYKHLFINGFFNRQLYRHINTGVRNDGLLNLYDDDFYDCELPVPPLHEQEKIAEILSTWDKAILLMEKLIEEKKKQKKWLMQNLLVPDSGVRLLGFEGEWETYKIADLGVTYGGLTGKAIDDFGHGKPYIPYLNIFSNPIVDINNLEFVYISENERQNKAQYGDIFFTISSETPEEVGMSSVLLNNVDEIYLNSFCLGFRLNNFQTLTPYFAAYYFRGPYLREILNKLAQGVTRYNLSKTLFMKSKIIIPPTIEEQTAIANVLSTADKEINLMEQKLEQLQNQKKALMQLLLTGIVRVTTSGEGR